MKRKFIVIVLILLFLFSLTTVKADFVSDWTDSYGLKADITEAPENQTPVLSSPYPSNGSTTVSINWPTWNITINDPEGDTFNWTIEISNGDTNSSNDDSNGTKVVDLTTPMAYSTLFNIWVNATDSGTGNWTNETFLFTTEDQFTFTAISTKSFGAKHETIGTTPSIESIFPTNTSSEAEMYLLLTVTVNEPQGDRFNITWKTNVTGPWTILQFNSSCSNGTYTYRATFANESNTEYWWRLEINDTTGRWVNESYYFTTDNYDWGDWSEVWEFNYSCCAPNSFTASTYNETTINLSWVNCDSSDTAILVRNATNWPHYPTSVTNGTQLDNTTNITYNDTGLKSATTYYYSIFGYNLTENEYSVVYNSASNTTQGELGIHNPFPGNLSTGNTRPPSNISARVNGTNIDVWIYFYNMTPYPNDVWTELYSWSGLSTSRVEVLGLSSANGTTEFIWGGTQYNWSVNVTDGSSWLNRTYYYNTTGSRYDLDNDSAVFVGDLNTVWAKRSATYDNLYDPDNDGAIFVGDLNTVWANRS